MTVEGLPAGALVVGNTITWTPQSTTDTLVYTTVVGSVVPGTTLETTIKKGTEIVKSYDTTVEKTVSFVEHNETLTGTNVVIVLDASGSMSGNKFQQAKNASVEFINNMFKDANDKSTVTVITFETDCNKGWCILNPEDPTVNMIGSATSAATATTLINNINKIDNDVTGGTPYYIGLEKAYDILYGSTNLSANGNENVMLFMSDGEPTVDDLAKRNAAISNLKTKGTEIYTVGYDIQNNSAEETILKNMATSNSNYYSAGVSGLVDVFDSISSTIASSNGSTQSSKGVASISNSIYVDATHPIIIYVDNVEYKRFSSLQAAINAGYITGNVTTGYSANMTKFTIGDVRFEYYGSVK